MSRPAICYGSDAGELEICGTGVVLHVWFTCRWSKTAPVAISKPLKITVMICYFQIVVAQLLEFDIRFERPVPPISFERATLAQRSATVTALFRPRDAQARD